MVVGDSHVFPGFLTPVLTKLVSPKSLTTFLTCFCWGKRQKYKRVQKCMLPEDGNFLGYKNVKSSHLKDGNFLGYKDVKSSHPEDGNFLGYKNVKPSYPEDGNFQGYK